MGALEKQEEDNRSRTHYTKPLPEIIDRIVDLAKITVKDNITILGADKIEMLLNFCSRGFPRVGCMAIGGAGIVEPVQVLVIPDIGQERDFQDILARAGRKILAGGTIVLHDSRPAPRQIRTRRTRHFVRFLAQFGFLCVGRDSGGRAGVLLVARKMATGDSFAYPLAA